MSQIIDYLTEIPRSRDRESLDLALVAGLKGMVTPLLVALYRPAGDPHADRCRALEEGQVDGADRAGEVELF